MALNVTIQDVVFSMAGTGPRKYKKAEVTYTWQGNNRRQTVMSFSNPDVFKTLESLKLPANVEVELTKVTGRDGTEYTNWAKITQTIGGESAPTASKPAGKVVGSNYETAEERAKRQLMIVRQSSVSNAISMLSAGINPGEKLQVTDVLEVAQEFVDFVYGNGQEEVVPLDRMPSDLPE